MISQHARIGYARFRYARLHLVLQCNLILAAIVTIHLATVRESLFAEENWNERASKVDSFIQKHCSKCHAGEQMEADLKFPEMTTREHIASHRKRWELTLSMVETSQMPPSDEPSPSDDERMTFKENVAKLFDELDRNAKPDPGRVTMRRLNRFEYRNTIRDLVGVDFNPADSFPSDDIGYGFDNIGDVLSLSPLLMERYLAAAEQIMNQAIVPNPPQVPKRLLAARFTEPASANVPTTPFRPITTEPKDEPIHTGPIFTRYNKPSGDFTFRTRLYATRSDEKPVKVAILVGGDIPQDKQATEEQMKQLSGHSVQSLAPFQIVQTFEVVGKSEAEAKEFVVDLKGYENLERIGIALFKPAEGEPHANLHIEYLGLDGPLDTRPASHQKLLAVDTNLPRDEQTKIVLERFATRAYRRPVTGDELSRLTTLAKSRLDAGETWEASMQFSMTAVLVSPKFLFRVELDEQPDSQEHRPLTEFQLASRLSYFLWGSMPDEELLKLASDNQLSSNLDAQVARMMRDPKAGALVESFALQWLQLQRLEAHQADRRKFRGFNRDLRKAMLEETKLCFLEIVREDKSILELLDANYTYLNAPLARHYGIADTKGNRIGQPPAGEKGGDFSDNKFVRVELADKSRGGLLTQASMLTVTSNPNRTSPVKRGRWILEQLLGTPPPAPPPNVPELKEEGNGAEADTLRERLEIHRKNPACANCHARMDPLGFALENFDAIGGYREKDGDQPIDSTGELPSGEKFSGIEELKAVMLGRKDQFAQCLTEKLLCYALGRGLESYDRPVVIRISKKLSESDYKMSVLISEIVKSEPFRMRRGL